MAEGFDSRAFLEQCSRRPGVYRMLDAEGKVLYVGKARDLRARLNSYFQKNVASIKTRALVARIASVETTVTGSETEALLLEQALIKDLRPPYNVLLRDDKSYPYIKVTMADDFPRVAFHRGTRRGKARYFGPYPNSGSVRETLGLVERIFQLRNCRDSYFRNRTRPCLQYQIERCTAPCVGLVSREDYARQVDLALAFLDGRDDQVTRELTAEMTQAAQDLDYERAAALRDRITAIRDVQQKQHVDTGHADVDIVAVLIRHGEAVVEMLSVRAGRLLGHRSHFPKVGVAADEVELLEGFLNQYYLGEGHAGSLPAEVVLDRPLVAAETLADAIARHAGRKVRFASSVRGQRRAWLTLARENAEQAIAARVASSQGVTRRSDALATLLDMPRVPARIECFDISHTGGEKAVASCVVFSPEGPIKSDYRRFNVSPPAGGDDYAALTEAVSRRYKRVSKEGGQLPELLLIDGGKGQVSAVAAALKALGLGNMPLLGISKGSARRAGEEQLHWADGRVIVPGADHPGLHLLQQVRDEAHRFALLGHRGRRGKVRRASLLEEIPGVGPKRRQQLLQHFGGLGRLREASREELAKVPGVSRELAVQIHDWFHE